MSCVEAGWGRSVQGLTQLYHQKGKAWEKPGHLPSPIASKRHLRSQLTQCGPGRVTPQQVQDLHPDYFWVFFQCFLTQCLQCFVKWVFAEESGVWYRYKEQALTRDRCFFYLLAHMSHLFPYPAPKGQKSVAITVKQSQFFSSKERRLISSLLRSPSPAFGALDPT